MDFKALFSFVCLNFIIVSALAQNEYRVITVSSKEILEKAEENNKSLNIDITYKDKKDLYTQVNDAYKTYPDTRKGSRDNIDIPTHIIPMIISKKSVHGNQKPDTIMETPVDITGEDNIKIKLPTQFINNKDYLLSYKIAGTSYKPKISSSLSGDTYTAEEKTTGFVSNSNYDETVPFDFFVSSNPQHAQIYYIRLLDWYNFKRKSLVLSKLYSNNMRLDISTRDDSKEIIKELNLPYFNNGSGTDVNIPVFETTYIVFILWDNTILMAKQVPTYNPAKSSKYNHVCFDKIAVSCL